MQYKLNYVYVSNNSIRYTYFLVSDNIDLDLEFSKVEDKDEI